MRSPTQHEIINRAISKEGGYKLVDVPGDRGKQTYAGISRRYHPNWPGWELVDRGQTPPQEMVQTFYVEQFWIPLGLDLLHPHFPALAAVAYEFATMAGIGDARLLLGLVGVPTAEAARGLPLHQRMLMIYMFEHLRVEHHRNDVAKHPKQVKFYRGWVDRANETTQWIMEA